MYSVNRQFGNLGEDIIVKKLTEKGFIILSRNYLKKWGEIDIVARDTSGTVHFVEVKTISRETLSRGEGASTNPDRYMPEEMVTREKLLKLERVIQSWISEHDYTGNWQIDIAAVELDVSTKRGLFRLHERVSL